MKLLAIIFFLFVMDIYFYTGTISTITKFFNNPIIYKLVYWFLSIAVYLVIIYISVTYIRTTPSIRLNNNVIFTSLVGVLFISKLIGSIPLIIDDILRLFKVVISLFNINSSIHDVCTCIMSHGVDELTETQSKQAISPAGCGAFREKRFSATLGRI